jgi:hypothetical protein
MLNASCEMQRGQVELLHYRLDDSTTPMTGLESGSEQESGVRGMIDSELAWVGLVAHTHIHTHAHHYTPTHREVYKVTKNG